MSLAAGIEIAAALLVPLATAIAEELAGGLDEEAATKKALERMQATSLPAPVLPRVRRMIADARAARSADDTRPVPTGAPGDGHR